MRSPSWREPLLASLAAAVVGRARREDSMAWLARGLKLFCMSETIRCNSGGGSWPLSAIGTLPESWTAGFSTSAPSHGCDHDAGARTRSHDQAFLRPMNRVIGSPLHPALFERRSTGNTIVKTTAHE